jgi:hypothetical protein
MPQEDVEQVEGAAADIEAAARAVETPFAPPQPIWPEFNVHAPPRSEKV